MSSETKILTTDGIPLEVSLKKAERKNKIKRNNSGKLKQFYSEINE